MTNIEATADGRFWVPDADDWATGGIVELGRYQRVRKVSGDYRYPGILVGLVRTPAGRERLMVFSTSEDTYGMLHIFAPEQMEPVPFPGD